MWLTLRPHCTAGVAGRIPCMVRPNLGPAAKSSARLHPYEDDATQDSSRHQQLMRYCFTDQVRVIGVICWRHPIHLWQVIPPKGRLCLLGPVLWRCVRHWFPRNGISHFRLLIQVNPSECLPRDCVRNDCHLNAQTPSVLWCQVSQRT